MSNVDQLAEARFTARFTESAFAQIAERPWRGALMAGAGAALAISLLGLLVNATHLALLIPPFGASCALLFAAPSSPLAQPKNLVGGHLLAAIAGLLMVGVFGPGVAAMATGVGLAIAAMVLTDTLHPPAGADPIVVALASPGWIFLLTPILLGTLILIAVASAWRYGVSRPGQ